MSVLMTAPFDTTGYGVSSVGYALALDRAGVDVACRRLVFNDRPVSHPPRFTELAGKDCGGADVLLMNSLPSHFYRPGGQFRKVVGMFSWETSKLPAEWVEKINLLDAVIVPCQHNLQVCYGCGVTVPVYVVPFAFDVEKYDSIYSPANFSLNKRGSYVFYTIGEATPRKNFKALISAFTLEFAPDEPVQLIVLAAGANKAALEAEFNEVKRGLKLYHGDQPKKETIITDFLPDEFVYALHQQSDCYVSASRGESFGMPCWEAKAFGKKVVATDTSGHRDYLSWFEKVPAIPQPCFGMTNTFPNLYTGEENWDEISIPHLRKQMRLAYESDYTTFADEKDRQDWLKAYSYEVVGESLRQVLEVVSC